MEFAEVLLACLDRLAEGGEAELERFAAAHPEHAERLRLEISRLRRLGLVEGGAHAQATALPSMLGGFRLIELLGEGGMGLVWSAEELALGRRVALKMVRPEQLCFPGARERFRREVETVARLQHPGIVPVYAVGEDGGVPYFTMEPIDGCTFADVIAQLRERDPARLSGKDLAQAIDAGSRASDSGPARGALFEASWIDACVTIARDVALALDYAHGRGLVHRDVKPSNIAITRAGRAMLLDFGLTQSATAERVTRSGSHPGSIPYMSPEQCAGAHDLDARTDVYSLGVTLYELLTLAPAFHGTPTEVLLKIKTGDCARPRARNRAIPREVETVCSVAMSPERDARYRSAAELARDLGHLLARRPIEVRPASPALRARRWAQRHPAWAVGGVLGCLLLFGGPSVLYVQQVHATREMSAKNVELADALATAHSESARAERNALETRAQRDRAEANLASAFDAVDRMLTRVGEKRLDTLPGIDSVRYELLCDALELYARLDRHRAGGAFKSAEATRTRTEMVRVLDRMGLAREAEELEREQLHDLLVAHLAAPEELVPARLLASTMGAHAQRLIRDGRQARAAELLAEADALLEEALCVQGGDSYTDADVWSIRGARGELLFDTGDVAGARAHYEVLDEQGFDRFLNENLSSAVLLELVKAITNHAFVLNHLRQGGAALAAGERALGVCQTVKVGEWDRTRTELELGATMQLALANDLLGRPDEDIRWQRRSLELARVLADHHPEAAEFRELVATNECNLGIRLARLDREAEALPLFESSVADFELLVTAQPDVLRFRYALATALTALAGYHAGHDEAARAVVEGERALEHALVAWEAQPKNPEYALNVGRCARGLCMSLAVQRDYRRMAEVLRDEPDRTRVRGVPYPAKTYRQLAAQLASAIELAGLDASLSAQERDEFQAQCSLRAVRCLEAAIERGFKDRADLETSKELEALRTSPEFARLFERL